MARSNIALQSVPVFGGALADTTFGAADAAGSYIVNNGNVVVQVKNASGSPINVTITSVADQDGRTRGSGDITAVADGKTATFGPFRMDLFNQSAAGELGRVYIDYSAATSVTVAAIQLNP
jgi:hypothetical protein